MPNPERRRRLLVAAVIGGVALTALLLAIWIGREAEPRTPGEAWARLVERREMERPNVVLITLDTLRADRLSSYGAELPETPHIDRLAHEGVRFANAATTVPFTLPAHSSIMTGAYPPRHGVRENVGYVLGEGLPTMAELLAAAGWRTAGFVSAFVLDSRWGIARGFETYFDDFELGDDKRANLGSVQRDGTETVSAALEWLDGVDEEPFFLWLHLFDAHDPYTPPEPYRSRYPGRPYDAEVAYVDALVGRFRSGLEERGLLESSLLVLTADHGEGLGQHKEGFHGFFIYDSTVRVPLIVRPPFRELGGRTVDEAVSHVDLLPTILEAAGREVPESVQGRSLLPLLLGMGEPEGEDRVVYTESLYPLLHYGWAPLRSIRTRELKLIDAPRPELYRPEGDADEERNLVLEERRTARDLRRRLADLRQQIEAGAEASTSSAVLDDETVKQLMALGYVAGRGAVSEADEASTERADPKDRIELHQLIMAAQSDIAAEDLERARERLERAVERDPTIIDGHKMLGTIAAEEGLHDDAVGHFQRALALDPELETAVFGLARAYQQLGRFEEALFGFERAADLDPENPRVALATADVLAELDRTAEAVAVLEAAAEWPSAPAVLFSRLGELLVESGRRSEAETRFRAAVERNDKLAQPHFNLAVLKEESGEVAEAVELYERAISLAPSHYQAQFNLGRLYGQLGDSRRQRELYEAALTSNPEFVRGYFFLAKVLMDMNEDLDRAEQLARTGLAKDPENRAGALGHFVLADLLNRQGRRDEAARAVATGRRVRALTDESGNGG